MISWFLFLYVVIGLFIMMEGIVDAWHWPEYSAGIKILGIIIAVLSWPLVFIN